MVATSIYELFEMRFQSSRAHKRPYKITKFRIVTTVLIDVIAANLVLVSLVNYPKDTDIAKLQLAEVILRYKNE